MTTEAAIVARVRRELGDFGRPFRDSFRGDGTTNEYDLSGVNLDPNSLSLTHIAVDNTVTTPALSTYQVDLASGILFLNDELEDGAVLVIEGTSYGMFSDDEIAAYVHDALVQHTNGRSVQVRYRDYNGFIRYDEEPMMIDNLPEIEELPLVLLSTINALWALTTDASTDIDIHTAEGTSVVRSQRYSQMLNQISLLEQRYDEIAKQLNIGLKRIEMLNLRRVSRRTNRLVPVFEAREYDDNSYPERLLPPIDARDEDESGIPSPAYQSGGWF